MEEPWISCGLYSPETEEAVLCWNGTYKQIAHCIDRIKEGYLQVKERRWLRESDGVEIQNVLCWTPIPKLPERFV